MRAPRRTKIRTITDSGPIWKDTIGYSIDSRGYYRRGKFDTRYKDVYNAVIGPIPKGWHIHHINCVRHDDRPENLIAVPATVHAAIHRSIDDQGRYLDRDEIQVFLKEYHVVLNSIRDLQGEIARLTRLIA